MGKFIHTENSFAAGVVSAEFFAHENKGALSVLENMDVLASGAISRRRGLARVAEIPNSAALIPFSAGENENYLLAVSAGHIRIFNNGTQVQNLIVPWNDDAIAGLQYAQRFDTMIFVHPDFQPQVLQKSGASFSLTPFDFSVNDDQSRNIPFIKFDDARGIKLTVATNSNGNNFATITASKNFWTPENQNGRLFFMDRQWVVHEVLSETQIVAVSNTGYTLPGAQISDWAEAAFGARRGWPCSITFHQNRLVFGGSKSHPAGVWMSCVGDHHNFDVGTGLDDQAIFLTLLSSSRQQVCTVVSSDNLQILTSVGEWAVSNKPLTPASVNIKQHTAIGSVSSRYLQPQNCDGATVFVSRSEQDIRELALDELGENYNANDLCARAKHLMRGPVDIAYNDLTHQLFVVMEQGEMAVLNKNPTTGISAWGIYKTAGNFESIAIMNSETYVSVRRGDKFFIEKFSDGALLDSNEFEFSYAAAGVPMLSGNHAPKKIRIKKFALRVLNTSAVFINGLRAPIPNEFVETGFSGDLSIPSLGTEGDTVKPLWKISGGESLPATVLSITTEGWYLI
ncbi:MAG: hypothetical protein LBJ18_02695 [Rickettsiales bacterium]|nr:hypothetical protein [Rickettsiales bacterium]